MSRTIFVFGSNLAGIHGAGSAKEARRNHGAQLGVGVGLTGNAYAIPTKDHNLKTMFIEDIAVHVNQFIDFARANPDWTFNVAAIGTGLAGFTHEEMTPLFADVPPNCVLPFEWILILEPDYYE